MLIHEVRRLSVMQLLILMALFLLGGAIWMQLDTLILLLSH